MNAVAKIGEEIDPYCRIGLARAGTMRYRTEAAILAFNERFDILPGLELTLFPMSSPKVGPTDDKAQATH